MDFVIGLPVSTNWKDKTYYSNLVIVNLLLKIIYYKPIKVFIDVLSLAKIIINIVVRYHDFSDSIISI